MAPRPNKPPPDDPPATAGPAPLTRWERAELEELRDAARRDGVKVAVTVNTPGMREADHFRRCPRCGSRVLAEIGHP